MNWIFGSKRCLKRNIKIVPLKWCDDDGTVYAVLTRKSATKWAYTCAHHFCLPNAADVCVRALPISVTQQLITEDLVVERMSSSLLYVFTNLKSANYCVRYRIKAAHTARKMSRRLTATFKKGINT